MPIRKHSLKPLPKLKRKAEKIFHAWVVKKEKGICFTCGKLGNQAGHFKHNRLDFDEMNVHCSCAYCNLYLHGNLGVYAVKLIDKYGRKKFDDLVFRANQVRKYTRDELEAIIKKYK